MFYPPFISNKMEQFSFKSGCVVRVENDEIRCQLQSSKTNVLAICIAAKDILAALY